MAKAGAGLPSSISSACAVLLLCLTLASVIEVDGSSFATTIRLPNGDGSTTEMMSEVFRGDVFVAGGGSGVVSAHMVLMQSLRAGVVEGATNLSDIASVVQKAAEVEESRLNETTLKGVMTQANSTLSYLRHTFNHTSLLRTSTCQVRSALLSRYCAASSRLINSALNMTERENEVEGGEGQLSAYSILPFDALSLLPLRHEVREVESNEGGSTTYLHPSTYAVANLDRYVIEAERRQAGVNNSSNPIKIEYAKHGAIAFDSVMGEENIQQQACDSCGYVAHFYSQADVHTSSYFYFWEGVEVGVSAITHVRTTAPAEQRWGESEVYAVRNGSSTVMVVVWRSGVEVWLNGGGKSGDEKRRGNAVCFSANSTEVEQLEGGGSESGVDALHHCVVTSMCDDTMPVLDESGGVISSCSPTSGSTIVGMTKVDKVQSRVEMEGGGSSSEGGEDVFHRPASLLLEVTMMPTSPSSSSGPTWLKSDASEGVTCVDAAESYFEYYYLDVLHLLSSQHRVEEEWSEMEGVCGWSESGNYHQHVVMRGNADAQMCNGVSWSSEVDSAWLKVGGANEGGGSGGVCDSASNLAGRVVGVQAKSGSCMMYSSGGLPFLHVSSTEEEEEEGAVILCMQLAVMEVSTVGEGSADKGGVLLKLPLHYYYTDGEQSATYTQVQQSLFIGYNDISYKGGLITDDDEAADLLPAILKWEGCKYGGSCSDSGYTYPDCTTGTSSIEVECTVSIYRVMSTYANANSSGGSVGGDGGGGGEEGEKREVKKTTFTFSAHFDTSVAATPLAASPVLTSLRIANVTTSTTAMEWAPPRRGGGEGGGAVEWWHELDEDGSVVADIDSVMMSKEVVGEDGEKRNSFLRHTGGRLTMLSAGHEGGGGSKENGSVTDYTMTDPPLPLFNLPSLRECEVKRESGAMGGGFNLSIPTACKHTIVPPSQLSSYLTSNLTTAALANNGSGGRCNASASSSGSKDGSGGASASSSGSKDGSGGGSGGSMDATTLLLPSTCTHARDRARTLTRAVDEARASGKWMWWRETALLPQPPASINESSSNSSSGEGVKVVNGTYVSQLPFTQVGTRITHHPFHTVYEVDTVKDLSGLSSASFNSTTANAYLDDDRSFLRGLIGSTEVPEQAPTSGKGGDQAI